MVDLSGFTNKYKLGSGLKPVFKIETCKSLKSGYIGDKIIEDTFPMFVKIADPDRGGITGAIGLGALRSKVTEFLGSQTTDTPLLGVMIDHAILNRYRTIANLIFQNVLKNKPTGNEYLSDGFIDCGYPIRVTIGFLTPEGNFVQHPYEGGLIPEKIYPTFTGIVAAQTQEIVSSGDRFQVTCYGFEYLLSKARCSVFEAEAGQPLREVFTNLLKSFAIMEEEYYDDEGNYIESTEDRLGPLESTKWPIPILRAMGLIGKKNKLLADSSVRKNIRLVNCDLPPVLLRDIAIPADLKSKKIVPSYLDVIRMLSPRPPSSIGDQISVAFGLDDYYTRHSFHFDYHGRPTIFGKFMSTAEIASGRGRPTHDRSRIRVHDAVIGSNIIHLQMNNTLDMTAGRVHLYHIDSDLSAGQPAFTSSSSEQAYKSRYFSGYASEVDSHTFYGPGSHWGRQDLFMLNFGDEVDVGGIEPDDLMKDIYNRYKNVGMRGSSYMICNPKMQVGDVLRITDIRDKDGFGTAIGATIDLGVKASTKIKSAVAKRLPSLDVSGRLPGETVNLGLKGIEDMYWVWKVRHYVGQNEITSKAFFVKEPQTLITTTDAYRQHQIQRKKAPRSTTITGDD